MSPVCGIFLHGPAIERSASSPRILPRPGPVTLTRLWQAGEGRQRLLAAASLNSALVSAVSAEGSARTQEDKILSLWRQAQAALLFGQKKVKVFLRTLAPVFGLGPWTPQRPATGPPGWTPAAGSPTAR